jgi:hypothetical protein
VPADLVDFGIYHCLCQLVPEVNNLRIVALGGFGKTVFLVQSRLESVDEV